MEKKYPTDKLLITRPWIVMHDDTVTKLVTSSRILKAQRRLTGATHGISKKYLEKIKGEGEYTTVHTVELKQVKEPTVVLPGLLFYEDVFTSKEYFTALSKSHNCEGDVVVLTNEIPGISGEVRSLMDEVANGNDLLQAYLLSIKPEMTREEISAYMEMYKKINRPDAPKTLTLQNQINGIKLGTFKEI